MFVSLVICSIVVMYSSPTSSSVISCRISQFHTRSIGCVSSRRICSTVPLSCLSLTSVFRVCFFFPFPTPRVLFSRNSRAPSSLSGQFRQGPPTPLEIKEGKLYKRTFGLGRLDRPADSPILALVTSCWKAQNTQASGRKERLHTNWAIKVLCLNTIIISAIFVLPGENGGTNQVVYGMQLSLFLAA